MEKTGVPIDEAVPVLKLLGDRTRLSIILMLNKRQCCVCEIVDVLDMSQPGISQHLRKLRDAKVVVEDRRGQWIYYSLNYNSSFFPLIEHILDTIPVQESLISNMNHAKDINHC